MSISSENSIRPIHGAIGLFILFILAILTGWSWQQWNQVWVERSEGFFPPEWQGDDTETLAWKYPIYRSNDSYHWVYLADSLAQGNSEVLQHRSDEGTQEGRPNAWNSGLAHLLRHAGSMYASTQDWPAERGIHHIAHWLGSILIIITAGMGMWLTSRIAGAWAGALFVGLFYFNAAIHWDFAFSRLDHEALFQLFLIIQLFGLVGVLRQDALSSKRWALIAGIGTAACWWISATMQMAISVFTMLGCLWASHYKKPEHKEAKVVDFLIWGGSAAIGILFACIVEHRNPFTASLSALHPIFALTQLGACSVCAAAALYNTLSKRILFLFAIIAGLTPLIWIGIYEHTSHTWFDPVIRRIHDHIVEFQSPFHNGSWRQPLFLQGIFILACFISTAPWKRHSGRMLFILSLCLAGLALMQTRWLGILASVSTIGLCVALLRCHYAKYVATVSMLLLLGGWAWQWKHIEDKPGIMFVTDMFLHVGARDLNLNLERLSQGQKTNVAIPYAFSSSSALFETVRPLGTLYWENRNGIDSSTQLFATADDNTALEIIRQQDIDYLAVQPLELGQPFVEMVTWTAFGETHPRIHEDSLAWRLSNAVNIPAWCEPVRFYGTFDPQRFSMRIYRVSK